MGNARGMLGHGVHVWTVLFRPVEQPPRWWERLLDQRYGHCLAIGWDGLSWLVVDMSLGHLTARSLPGSPDRYPFDDRYMTGCTDIIDVPVNPDVLPQRWRSLASLKPLTCVEMVQSLIGVDWPLTFTPAQLRRKLMVYNREHGSSTENKEVA